MGSNTNAFTNFQSSLEVKESIIPCHHVMTYVRINLHTVFSFSIQKLILKNL